MKISILLAAYKSEELLRKVFIPSLKKHGNAETELIIYDNGYNLREDEPKHIALCDYYNNGTLGFDCSRKVENW
jgi:hypothetical protein